MTIKNLIKYTIGLPILVGITFLTILFYFVLFVCVFGGDVVDFLLNGDTDFHSPLLEEVKNITKTIWKPIKK